MYSRALHEALGLAEQDQIVGFLYLGTPATALRQPTLVASADLSVGYNSYCRCSSHPASMKSSG